MNGYVAGLDDGTWDAILAWAQVYDDGQPVEWVISVDSSVVRAHQHAAGAHKKGDRPAGSRYQRRMVKRWVAPAAG